MAPTMKLSLVVIFLCLAVINAEPPRRRFQPLRFQRQRFQRLESAPYPPSGWKPDTPFYLPGEEPTEAPAPEEETTTAGAAPEETTTAAPAEPEGEEDQEVDSSNLPQDASQRQQQAPIFVIIPERTVYQPIVAQDPYTGAYYIQDYQQRYVQILKK